MRTPPNQTCCPLDSFLFSFVAFCYGFHPFWVFSFWRCNKTNKQTNLNNNFKKIFIFIGSFSFVLFSLLKQQQKTKITTTTINKFKKPTARNVFNLSGKYARELVVQMGPISMYMCLVCASIVLLLSHIRFLIHSLTLSLPFNTRNLF